MKKPRYYDLVQEIVGGAQFTGNFVHQASGTGILSLVSFRPSPEPFEKSSVSLTES